MATLNAAVLLKQNKLRLTKSRTEILALLQRLSIALSHTEIEKRLPSDVDRITTYRTLVSFRKKGIIHVVIDPQSGVAKYILTRPELPTHHAHFKCTQCNLLICLETEISTAESLLLPKGYRLGGWSFVVEGLCERCSR